MLMLVIVVRCIPAMALTPSPQLSWVRSAEGQNGRTMEITGPASMNLLILNHDMSMGNTKHLKIRHDLYIHSIKSGCRFHI
jgi:hypothetical protein